MAAMSTVSISLVSHTNVGKTTLARTLLVADIGEVRDAPHVTEFAEGHELIASPEGDRLQLWDAPGFGDSARLVRRMRQSDRPLGWLLASVWDRFRDRPFWASQQALRHVREQSDVVLYLVNAAELPEAAGYVAPEMELLAWVGKPVLVLLNQTGAPRAPEIEATEVQAWREQLARWPRVVAVLPLDAFARCWVHELTLLNRVQSALEGDKAAAMQRLIGAWQQRQQALFGAALSELAQSLARTAAARQALATPAGMFERLQRLGARLGGPQDSDPAMQAQQALALELADEVRDSTGRLIKLHGLAGAAQAEILQRVQGQFALRERVGEGKAALLGGAVTGALAGLKADLATGGLTLGGGLIAGALIGALGAAGVARGINVVRGTDQSWVAWSDAALSAAAEAALVRYLAVAHFGRGRGDWVLSEAPPHWPATVAAALAPQHEALTALWRSRSTRFENPGELERLAKDLQPLLREAAERALVRLYPGADNPRS